MATFGMMDKEDLVVGGEGSAYITIGESRYCLGNLKSIEATITLRKTQTAVLGKRAKITRIAGMDSKGKATMFYNNSILRKMILNYKDTGKMADCEIQLINEDPGSNAGKQEVFLKGVVFDSITLAKLDVSSDDQLEEDVEFTFDDYTMPKEFELAEKFYA